MIRLACHWNWINVNTSCKWSRKGWHSICKAASASYTGRWRGRAQANQSL